MQTKCLLVGINTYPGAPLSGCVNDIMDMAHLLVSRYGVRTSEIRMLTDARATTAAITDRLRWLTLGLQPGDRVLYHFSGHGAEMVTRDSMGDPTHKSQAECPYDFDWSEARALRDKDFVRLFGGIPAGVEFVWISDSCHSASLTKDLVAPAHAPSVPRSMPLPVDIAWRHAAATERAVPHSTLRDVATRLKLALVAGCRHNETSADATFGGRSNGALTYHLLQRLRHNDGTTAPLSTIVADVAAAVKSAGFTQHPQLEGDPIVESRPFLRVP